MPSSHNQKIRDIYCVLWCLLFLLIAGLEVGTASDGLVVKLTGRDGAEISVPDVTFYSGDGLLANATAAWTTGWKPLEMVILEIAKGAYMAIPVGIFKEAELKGGIHVVTLGSGEQLQGKLVGYVKSGKSETKHALGTAKKIVVTSLPFWESDEAERMKNFQPKEVWQLEVKQPVNAAHAVIGPDFKFQYHPESNPSETHYSTSQRKFGIRKDGQVTFVSLDDVVEMSLSPAAIQGSGVNVDATLKLKSGSDITGSVVIGKDGNKETAIRWVLAATVRGSGMQILISNPSCRLSRTQ